MTAIEKELQKIGKTEERLRRQAEKKSTPIWKEKLEEKVPVKVMAGLQKVFSKAFYQIFEKGSVIIEKTYDKDSIAKDFQINDYAVDIKGNRKVIRHIKNEAFGSNALNTVVTTIEGIGLGAFGIGLPDIMVWVGILMRGIYKTALQYGFDYGLEEERLFILQMIETSMQTGENWIALNSEIDNYIRQEEHAIPDDFEMNEQIERTANSIATEMLVTKFIQGLPVVGVIGGVSNPIFYHKIMQYVQLKYRKRYLLGKGNK